MSGTYEILILKAQTGLRKTDWLSPLSGRRQNHPEGNDRIEKEDIARARHSHVHIDRKCAFAPLSRHGRPIIFDRLRIISAVTSGPPWPFYA